MMLVLRGNWGLGGEEVDYEERKRLNTSGTSSCSLGDV